MTKTNSRQGKINDNDEVYRLIAHLQENEDDQAVKERLVLHFTGLVHSLAYKYSHNSSNHEDLAQVGMVGLLISLQRYDAEFGRTFEAYAIPTIIGEIKRYIRDKTWGVHVPRRIKELGPKIKRTADELTIELQRSPSVDEIATAIGVSEEEVLETMEMSTSYRALSVDYKHEVDADGGSFTLLDLISDDEDEYKQVDLHMIIETVLPSLSEREQEILKLIFFENLSQKEVGELLGISQMHVSRLQRRALRKLREVLEQNNADIYDLVD